MITELSRPLLNPPVRMEIRPDFPEIIDVDYYSRTKGQLLDVIKQELQKDGASLQEVKRITLVHPHRHPDQYEYRTDRARILTGMVREMLTEMEPEVTWLQADGLIETQYFNRSHNQSALHALTGKQMYKFCPSAQKDPLPFADPSNREKEYFVLVDHRIEQGSTLANLMSAITYNGGYVLAAGVHLRFSLAERSLPQRAKNPPAENGLTGAFTDSARNTARLSEMAEAFAASASGEQLVWSPQECLERFERALIANGNSVFAMTDAECERVIETVSGRYWRGVVSFPALLNKLEERAPALSLDQR